MLLKFKDGDELEVSKEFIDCSEFLTNVVECDETIGEIKMLDICPYKSIKDVVKLYDIYLNIEETNINLYMKKNEKSIN